MKKYLVKANLARGAVDVSGGVPESIEYMPAGVHTISCLVNGKAKEITVSVSEQTAAQLQESLDAVLRAFAAGEMSRPFRRAVHGEALYARLRGGACLRRRQYRQKFSFKACF